MVEDFGGKTNSLGIEDQNGHRKLKADACCSLKP